jgi:hypothetical protein
MALNSFSTGFFCYIQALYARSGGANALDSAYLRVAKQFGIPTTIPSQHTERRFPAYINSIPPDEAWWTNSLE